MINAIVGQLVSVNAQNIHLLAGNIEFNIIVSSRCATFLSKYQGTERDNVRLLTYLKHSEDSMVLYGFNDEQERMLFLELIKVNGIGPKQAIKILSAVSVSDFIKALDQSNINFLSKIPGLGSKTSQKIILALRDTLVFETEEKKTENNVNIASHAYQEIADALVDMGYDKKRVYDVIAKLLEENKEVIEGKSSSMVEEWLFRNCVLSLN